MRVRAHTTPFPAHYISATFYNPVLTCTDPISDTVLNTTMLLVTGASSFDMNISEWDTEYVEDFQDMFNRAAKLVITPPPISDSPFLHFG